jgi:Fe2+ transport system protein FeoA
MLKALSELDVGQTATIAGFRVSGTDPEDDAMALRLMELGFIKNSQVYVIHEAPFTHDPIAVVVRGKKIAVRRSDAALVLVSEKEVKV